MTRNHRKPVLLDLAVIGLIGCAAPQAPEGATVSIDEKDVFAGTTADTPSPTPPVAYTLGTSCSYDNCAGGHWEQLQDRRVCDTGTNSHLCVHSMLRGLFDDNARFCNVLQAYTHCDVAPHFRLGNGGQNYCYIQQGNDNGSFSEDGLRVPDNNSPEWQATYVWATAMHGEFPGWFCSRNGGITWQDGYMYWGSRLMSPGGGYYWGVCC